MEVQGAHRPVSKVSMVFFSLRKRKHYIAQYLWIHFLWFTEILAPALFSTSAASVEINVLRSFHSSPLWIFQRIVSWLTRHASTVQFLCPSTTAEQSWSGVNFTNSQFIHQCLTVIGCLLFPSRICKGSPRQRAALLRPGCQSCQLFDRAKHRSRDS